MYIKTFLISFEIQVKQLLLSWYCFDRGSSSTNRQKNVLIYAWASWFRIIKLFDCSLSICCCHWMSLNNPQCIHICIMNCRYRESLHWFFFPGKQIRKSRHRLSQIYYITLLNHSSGSGRLTGKKDNNQLQLKNSLISSIFKSN